MIKIHKGQLRVTVFSSDNYLLETINNRCSTYKFDFKRKKTTKDRSFSLHGPKTITVIEDDFPIVKTAILQKGYKIDEIISKEYKPVKKEYKSTDAKKPRGYQKKIVKVINARATNRYLVELPPGKGKTYISALTVERIGYSAALLIKPNYVAKWLNDLKENLNIDKERVYVVQKNATIHKLFKMSRKEYQEKYDFVIFTTKTMTAWFKDFENMTEKQYRDKYALKPLELFRHLGIGTLVADEVHQDFHAVYRSMLALDPKVVIGLSASLVTKNRSLERFYYKLFPEDGRLNDYKFGPYVILKYYIYEFSKRPRFDFKRRNFGYSHDLYEAYINNSNRLQRAYFDMILDIIEKEFKLIDKDDKCLIFLKRIDTIVAITEYAKSKFGDKYGSIAKYTGEDEYETIMTNNIIFSTLGSSGTALDIPNLTVAINTIAVDSPASNIQSHGRLREIEGKDVKYIQLYNNGVFTHKNYRSGLTRLLKPRSKSLEVINYGSIPKESQKSLFERDTKILNLWK